MKIQKSLIALAVISTCMAASAFATSSQTNITVNEHHEITKITTTASADITSEDKAAAVAGTDLNITLATGLCIYQNHATGVNLTPTGTSAHHATESQFKAYSAAAGSFNYTLQINSVNNLTWTDLAAGVSTPLTDRGDISATSGGCSNAATLRAHFSAAVAAAMPVGTYQLHITLATSNYAAS